MSAPGRILVIEEEHPLRARPFEEFLDREKLPSPHPRAVDLGCGLGTHAVQLAECGWAVTGVDQVPRAIQAARRLAVAANQEISFVEGDVTNLPDIGAGFQFVLDVGCFHGLSGSQRGQFGQQVDLITDIGATMLMLAFERGGRGPLPRGADRDDLITALPHWSIIDQQAADTSGMPAPLRSRAPQVYRLRRN